MRGYIGISSGFSDTAFWFLAVLLFYADVGHEIVPMQVTPAEHWVRGRMETRPSVCKFITNILLVLPSVRVITAQVSATGRSSSSRVPTWYVPPADTALKFAARIIAIRVRGPTFKILDAVLSALNKVELDSVSVLDDTSKLLFYLNPLTCAVIMLPPQI